MTDNEIVKALYYLYCAAGYKETVTMSKETAIGLYEYFNRQKAKYEDVQEQFRYLDIECERLEKANESQKAEIEALINGQETLQKYIAEQKAEIERLTKCRKEEVKKLMTATDKVISEAKAEAIKEFLSKLKMHARKMTGADFGGEFWDAAVLVEDAESIAKEMVGDNND